jgi:hypothetical protein
MNKKKRKKKFKDLYDEKQEKLGMLLEQQKIVTDVDGYAKFQRWKPSPAKEKISYHSRNKDVFYSFKNRHLFPK